MYVHIGAFVITQRKLFAHTCVCVCVCVKAFPRCSDCCSSYSGRHKANIMGKQTNLLCCL